MSLRERFPRLFHLNPDQEKMIGDMGEWSGQDWVWSLRWKREARGRDAEAMSELVEWLDRVKLRRDRRDCWAWGNVDHGGFSVRKAYDAIKARMAGQDTMESSWAAAMKLLWQSKAPFKYKLVGWRALHNRLPTRDQLHSRLHLTPIERRCPSCLAEEESATHFLLHCSLAANIWSAVVQWVGVDWVAPPDMGSHLRSFANLLPRKGVKKVMGALWNCVVWVMWKWRNNMIFENKCWDPGRMKEEIKCRLWSWCSIKRPLFDSYLKWSSVPLADSLRVL